MPELFSAKELIEVAIREEHTGAVYYRAVAEAAGTDELAAFAMTVAHMEDEHEAEFRSLLESLGPPRPPAESYEGEYGAYMAYLLEGRIFPTGRDGVELARNQPDDRSAVETALELERNTLLFYHEMLPFVPEEHHDLLNGIIAEERQHVTDLARYHQRHF